MHANSSNKTAEGTTLSMSLPDDWHIHLRDEDVLPRTVNDAAQQFGRVLVMPNLVPPVTTVRAAIDYRERILGALEAGKSLDPKMTLYLTDDTTEETVVEAANSEHIVAFKWYPAGATTNSASGVTSYKKIAGALEAMEKNSVVLCVHGEVTDSAIDIFDREAEFIDRTLRHVIDDFPKLKVVFEHITTKDAVDFVFQGPDTLAATITAHHLLFNRNHMLVGGIKPHYYCLPVLKRNIHQQALLDAATSGNRKFFLGTDSAPHDKASKESACGCAGAYTANAAMQLYASAFAERNAMNRLADFANRFGAEFYDVPLNTEKITIRSGPCTVPDSLVMADASLVPLCAGETLNWQFIR